MVFHHVGFIVSSLSEAKKFYLAALAPLGYKELHSIEGIVAGLGANGASDLWLVNVKGPDDSPTKGLHLAFKAESREVVDQFYEAALKAGGKDNGAPGERTSISSTPGYYAAYIHDLEGNNIEVVHV
ncbi:glyoxalase/bleomycin resistance protein/dioxygenase [Crucibulum laeve]|uniref:Glyoxalase/bleomycin resistance protein/dioxygenase n=1 Tax=Crucibulum laeve TaxID=68775 RepID=A0A5C3MB54_9AGAR|nr:glyoxalase/bleomycin resistance protein/dioxygenase [Crucibulum laeve]